MHIPVEVKKKKKTEAVEEARVAKAPDVEGNARPPEAVAALAPPRFPRVPGSIPRNFHRRRRQPMGFAREGVEVELEGGTKREMCKMGGKMNEKNKMIHPMVSCDFDCSLRC